MNAILGDRPTFALFAWPKQNDARSRPVRVPDSTRDAGLSTRPGQSYWSGVVAVRHGLMNVAFGLAIIGAAVIVSTPRVVRFQILYAIDAATYLAAGVVLGTRPAPLPAEQIDAALPRSGRGYREVFPDRAFRWLCLTEAALVEFGYVQFHAAHRCCCQARVG